MTALAGQVLTLDGRALEGVTLRIGETITQTDTTGRFLLTSISPGHHVLRIIGRTAGAAGRAYGMFEAGVDVTEGETNILPYTVWMPEIDIAHAVTIPSPTTEEVVLTTPHIPGLEVRIPPGTVITDEDGRVVTQLGITPIPVDRPPFPLARGVDVPVFFTVQPGGAYINPRGARLIYPNYDNQPPGMRTTFWNYDPDEKGWYIYGQGTVTPDGKQVVPDPDVAIYEFTGAMINSGRTPPNDGPPPGCGAEGGDPVDLNTGLFVLQKTDFFIPDILPLALTRTYRPNDTVSRSFGIGTTFPFDIFLFSAQQFQEADLILPDGGRVHYVRISPGVGFDDAEFEHTSTPTVFYKSRIKWNGNGWNLTLKDGTVYVFGETAPLQAIQDRYGNKITISRAGSPVGNITQVRSPNGRRVEFTYDASNRIIQAKDNVGRLVAYTYDASGRVSRVTDPSGGVTEYTYDASHRMLTIKDPRAIVFLTNEYDATGRVIRQTQADGSTYQFAYTLDANGKISQTLVTDPRGNIRRVTFNAGGYILTNTRALGQVEEQTSTYERQQGTNLVLSFTDPFGRKTAYTYDALGNITSITYLAGTPEAAAVIVTYEPRFNHVASVTDPLGHTTSFAYDDKGNLIAEIDPIGNRSTLTHNEAGQLVSITDPLGNITRLTYDRGDLVAVTDPLGSTITQSVDNVGRLISLTNPLGQSTRYDYDALNLLIRATDPLGGVTTFIYDPNGNPLQLQDARGSITRYAYDTMDQLVSRTNPLQRDERCQYDAIGNLTKFTDRKGEVTVMTYDTLNRFKQVTYADGSTTSYTFDAGNRLIQVTDSVSGTITCAYDNLDRLTSETTLQGTIRYTYDASGRRTSMTVVGQPAVSYTYDGADQLIQLTRGTSTITIAYNSAGQSTALTLPTGVSVGYTYDAASRLTAITYRQGATVLGNLTYEYDVSGNVTKVGGTFARTVLPQVTASLTYDASNRLTQNGTTTLTYDDNGNLMDDGSQRYSWDARDQLASINSSEITASFEYDGFGRRIRKTVNGVTTEILYDVLNAVQELSAGMPTANLLTGLGVDDVLIRANSAGIRGFLQDGLGSTLALCDSVGAIRTQYTYEPFGRTTVSGEANENSLQYTGRENDGTGLYYYRARYYSPTWQRYISEDPIGFYGRDINLYVYADNNPVNTNDPLGLVSAPGFLESMIPVWGAAKQAMHDFECGNWGWGLFNLALAVSDFLPFVSLGKSIAQVGLSKLVKFGSHNWKTAVRPWLRRSGWRETGEVAHHWFFFQNGYVGGHLPEWFKNQPWNLMPMSRDFHIWLHEEASFLQQVWHGTPRWAKAVTVSAEGRAASSGLRKM
jgi:RHS repeat-associated protein